LPQFNLENLNSPKINLENLNSPRINLENLNSPQFNFGILVLVHWYRRLPLLRLPVTDPASPP